jgi:cobalt-precorrin-7 (C5)-methyltransferase
MKRSTVNKINVCGLGPGHPSLILPAVCTLVKESDVVIGGERHLSVFDLKEKEILVIRDNMEQVMRVLLARESKKVSVLVSGDTGFYSMLRVIRDRFSADELNVVPGISSFQYLFARLGMSYENACLVSLHGKEADIVAKVRQHPIVFCLTDHKQSWQYIARELCLNGLGDCTMHLGNRLSYEDESIISGKAADLIQKEFGFKLCSVIIENGK